MDERYPLTYSVDYPVRDLNRLTTFFRPFMLIPIAIVAATVSGANTWDWDYEGNQTGVIVGAGGVLFAGPLLMILFREKYPRWWFDWNLELLRFTNRVCTYFVLMSDRYPSTDERQWVQLDLVCAIT